jgi:hypothetical protein
MVVSRKEAASELNDKHASEGQLRRFEVGPNPFADLIDDEAKGDPHERQSPDRQFPRNLVAFDERVVGRACGHQRTSRDLHRQTTSRYLLTLLDAPPFEQVTVTGQLPGVVRPPTFHVQDAIPVEFADVGPRPDAVEGPDLYSTSIEQLAPANVLAFAVA